MKASMETNKSQNCFHQTALKCKEIKSQEIKSNNTNCKKAQKEGSSEQESHKT